MRFDYKSYRTDHANYIHDIKIRILEKCVQNENGCLEYRQGKLKHKYGLTSITLLGVRQSIPVHRALWMAVNNQLNLSRDIVIRHKCDNPCCCNIEHLISGAQIHNMRDMIDRGRRKKPVYKPRTNKSRVTPDMIIAIRAEPDTMMQRHIAFKYGISIGYVSKLRNMKAKALI